MVAIAQGDIWWADLAEPIGSEPGFQRPVVVVQGDAINRSRVGTIMVVPLTSTIEWAGAPGNVTLTTEMTGLPKDSVANVSQIIALDRRTFTERAGKIAPRKLDLILSGIDIVLGR